MTIVKSDVLAMPLDFFNGLEQQYPYIMNLTEHYRLLSYLSQTAFNNETLIDAGTYLGHSALALAQNPSNTIMTYDIAEFDIPLFKNYDNIKQNVAGIESVVIEILITSPLIVLDVNPHDGVQEKKFIDYLKEIRYDGYVVCDDIFLNEGMKSWWEGIDIEKYDLTDIGHITGTGLINFKQDKSVQLI